MIYRDLRRRHIFQERGAFLLRQLVDVFSELSVVHRLLKLGGQGIVVERVGVGHRVRECTRALSGSDHVVGVGMTWMLQ